MAARIVEVCDAVVAAILAEWTASASPPGAADGVERVYTEPAKFGSMTGRRVWVSPAGVAGETASRAEDVGVSTVAIVVAERYTGQGAPPVAWVDERVAFVQLVLDLVGSYGNRRQSGKLLVGTPARPHWTERWSSEVYEWTYLDEHKVFWSETEVEFREVRG